MSLDTQGHGSAERFSLAWAAAAPIAGWLTEQQANDLWTATMNLAAGGRVVEIGSFHGRSTVVLGLAAQAVEAQVTAVDPFRGWRHGSSDVSQDFYRNLASNGLQARVEHRASKSRVLRKAWFEPLELLFIDGKHDVVSAVADLRWAKLVKPGGCVFVHDAFSSFGVTLAIFGATFWSQTLNYQGRSGSLARFSRMPADHSSRARMLQSVPYWLQNSLTKVQNRLSRVLRPGKTFTDPY